MPAPIESFISDAETLLSLEPEDLAAICLEAVQNLKERLVTLDHLTNDLFADRNIKFPHQRKYEIDLALAEAWQWLQQQGLIVNAPDQTHTSVFFVLTRRGRAFRTAADLKAYRAGEMLPRGSLSPILEEKVRPMFLRGDYDVAVFQAFKEVEIDVRRAARLPDDLVGTSLMRKAFQPEDGPLRSRSAVFAEREAMAHLFAGAIGYAKNPVSHRNVTLDRISAARLIMLASELLLITKLCEEQASGP